MLEIVKGGYELSPEDENTLNIQRAITLRVNQDFIQVGAIYLKMSSKNPTDDDWFVKGFRDVDLHDWIDSPDARLHNVGFNLQQGWLDFDIDSDDPEYNRCIISAMDFLNLDSRFRFGRMSGQVPTHVLVKLNDTDVLNYEELKKFEPKPIRLKKQQFHTQLRTYVADENDRNGRDAKQTVMPGSIYSAKSGDREYDISVWYSGWKVAESASQISVTTPRYVPFSQLIRAITFGTFAYIMGEHWVEGSRQAVAQRVCGWLARVVRDSSAINNHDGVANSVFCPIDTDDLAEGLIRFTADYYEDDEPHMRVRAYGDAKDKLDRNPDAKIPGWPAMEQMIGSDATQAMRTVLFPGSDVSPLTKMAERYIYDESDNMYIDRERFWASDRFVHEGPELERRHRGDIVRFGGKAKGAFGLFESSNLRQRIGNRDLYPDLAPGSLYRVNAVGRVLPDEADPDNTSLVVFNTWKGWAVNPPDRVDEELLGRAVAYFDKLLGYITRDNPKQADWLKKWIAWTVQFPGKKQQIAPVIVGGQGVGKSFFGNVFLKGLFRHLWGTASPKVLAGDFSVEPFLNKMVVFIDEARFRGDDSTEEIKKLIRNVQVGGAEKFNSARTYQIYSRVVFASNRFDMNIGQANTQDRALFYMKTYDKDHLHLSAIEFRKWAETLKPWFEEYDTFLERDDVFPHYMHYFRQMQVNKQEVESVMHSSSGDAEIVSANMAWPRRVAKYIIEDGRIYEDLDITFPFVMADLNKRVVEVCKEIGLGTVQGVRVMAEFQEAGLVESVTEKGRIFYRFKYKLGTLTNLFGEAIAVNLDPRFAFEEDDYGPNTATTEDRKMWRGANSRLMGKF